MTQEEFAERIGISQNYLSTMERGKVEIGAEILLRIGREFAKSVEWLLTGKSSVSDLVNRHTLAAVNHRPTARESHCTAFLRNMSPTAPPRIRNYRGNSTP